MARNWWAWVALGVVVAVGAVTVYSCRQGAGPRAGDVREVEGKRQIYWHKAGQGGQWLDEYEHAGLITVAIADTPPDRVVPPGRPGVKVVDSVQVGWRRWVLRLKDGTAMLWPE